MGQPRLADWKVRAIRHEYADGYSMPSIATKYRITKQAVHKIVHHVSYREVV